MRIGFIFSLIAHAILFWIFFAKIREFCGVVPPAVKYEKFEIVKMPKGKSQSSKKAGGSREQFRNYSELLKGSQTFLNHQSGGLQFAQGPDVQGVGNFKIDRGHPGKGIKFGSDLKLAFPVPLFLLRLQGGEESESILAKCPDGPKWKMQSLKGDPILRTYFFEKIFKETLLADNFVFLRQVPFKQLKFTMHYMIRDYESSAEYGITVDGNHYTIDLYSMNTFQSDNGYGYDNFKHEMVHRLPPSVDLLGLAQKAINYFFYDEDKDPPEIMQLSMEAQIRASINKTLKKLKRSPAYLDPAKAMDEFTCAN